MTAHLLLIEDDEAAAYLTLKLLKRCGFTAEIHVVNGGREAIDYLTCRGKFAGRQTGNPALILLDLKMPNFDGFEVIKQIRTTPALSDIVVFILSASKSDEDIDRSNLLGVSKYLVKPLNAEEFVPEARKLFSFKNFG